MTLKEKQGALKEAVEDAFKYNRSIDCAAQMEAEHGWIETRDARILDVNAIEDKNMVESLHGMKTLVEIKSTVDYRDHIAATIRLYISDEGFLKDAYFNMLARGHWSIENQLHWSLDVTFKEDACRARKGFAVRNLSTIHKLAMRIAKGHNGRRNINKRLFRAMLTPDYLMEMLLSAKISLI